MKGIFKKTAAITLALTVSVSLCDIVYAHSANTDSAEQTELFVRASQINDYGTYSAIQSALDTARYGASDNNIYRVTVEPGSYDLTRSLHIYSNTILTLEGVTLNRNPGATANMLRTGDYDSEKSGATGYDAHTNILVEGGIFDGGGTNNTMIKAAHAKDFTMKGVTFQNEHNGHIMEIAGVDGFNVLDCTFQDQYLEKDEVGYEAIQLDILKSGHIAQCRSEALTMKNIRIENCDFKNCPRGIGSHTAILNAPFDGVIIRNNTFTDMTSAAIQGMNWKNVEITGNVIDGTPRGISIYSMFDGGQGMYPAGVLAREGNTSTDISENYQRPTDSNILISDNTISHCGTVADIYAPYASAGISVIGKVISQNNTVFDDGSGALPTGDYYLTGIKIFGNSIDSRGYGIQLSDASSVNLSNNLIRCAENKFDQVKYHGISMTNDSVVKTISGCDIEGSPNSGIHADDSWIGTISDCRVADSGADAVQLNHASSAQSVSDNYISGTKDCGVAAMSKSNISGISGNTIRDYKNKAVYEAKDATALSGKNYSTEAELQSISLNLDTITMGIGESYAYSISANPPEAKTCFMWTTSDPSVAQVEYDGRIRAVGKGSCEVTVTAGNGVSVSGYIRVFDAPDRIALNKNMLVLGEGEQFDLNSSLPEGTASQKVYYYSNNIDSVTVEKAGGMVTAKKTGTATVVAKTYNDKPASCNVIVKKAPTSIKLEKTELHIGSGERLSLKATLSEGTASAITFSSSDKSVVSVDDKGNLFAVTKGKATITASTYNGLKATCEITVDPSPDGISLNKENVTLQCGGSFQLEASLIDGMSTVTFQSSDPNVCKVDKVTGKLTAKLTGGAVITATTHNGKTASCEVKVLNVS